MLKKLWNNRKNRKGFTLVELIVVVAILGILAAIAIPNLQGVKYRQAINADGSTAATIARAARLQQTETGTAPTTIANIEDAYLKSASSIVPQSGGTFALSYSGDVYTVTWTPTKGPNTSGQTYTEGTPFAVKTAAAT